MSPQFTTLYVQVHLTMWKEKSYVNLLTLALCPCKIHCKSHIAYACTINEGRVAVANVHVCTLHTSVLLGRVMIPS